MSDLVDFLLARIADDEAVARKVLHETVMAADYDYYGWASVDYNSMENDAHGSRWSPKRVLAECAAKRAVVFAYVVESLADDESIARAASGSTVVGEPYHWKPAPDGDEWEPHTSPDWTEVLVALRPGVPRPPDVMGGQWGAVMVWETDHEHDAADYSGTATHIARWDPKRVLAECAAKRSVILALAQLYSGHPDFDERWKA